MDFPALMTQAHEAFSRDDAATVGDLLRNNAELRAKLNEPQGEFGAQAIVNVKSRQMLDVLLEHGADLNAKSRWWAGGFGVLHSAPLDVAKYAVERGAQVDIHAAARLGNLARVRELVSRDPALVHARGGDGQTPLHFAANRDIAAYLLDHGADLDARDIDHESTPAQWMLGERSDLARFLVERGCATDLLMAAALGDLALVQNHLARDPGAIRIRVSEEYFPMVGGKTGGTIYQWVLGWHVSAHQVAKMRGHTAVFQYLWEHSPVEVQLINAAWLHDAKSVEEILGRKPALQFTGPDLRQVAHAARNNDAEAVRLLLLAGLPASGRGQHNATALNWACWHGNRAAVEDILRYGPDLEDKQNEYSSTPLGWAMHGSENGWHRGQGDYTGTIQALARASVKSPDKISGTAEVQALVKNIFAPR